MHADYYVPKKYFLHYSWLDETPLAKENEPALQLAIEALEMGLECANFKDGLSRSKGEQNEANEALSKIESALNALREITKK